jgi:hypothetical protein
MHFELSDNSKVKFKKNHYNTFGLTHGLPENGGTCPGATFGKGGCLDVRDGLKRKTCYSEKLVKIYPAFGERIDRNYMLVRDKPLEEIKQVCRETVQAFIQKSKGEDLCFRLHMVGDFHSEDYTNAWAAVIKEFPNVHFWAYTRSDEYAELLFGIPNLSIYLSCDPVNFNKMHVLFKLNRDKYPNLGLAWMGNNPPALEGLDRFVTCPETSGKIQSTGDKGACSKCKLCINNFKTRIKNVAFKIH